VKIKIFPIYKKYSGLKVNSKKEIEKIIRREVRKTSDRYAGFRKISYLINYVWQKEANAGELKKIAKILGRSKIEKRILLLSKQCERILPTSEVNVFIFPIARTRENRKVIDDLHGVTAYTPWQKNFVIFVHPQRDWKRYFDMTVVHEYNHSVRMQHFPPDKNRTILDWIILEGMADNFVKAVTGFIPTWARPFPKKTEVKILEKIKDRVFNKVDYYSFHENLGIMFGDKEFPHWAGYRIGSSIVSNFLRKNPVTFEKLVKMDSADFFMA